MSKGKNCPQCNEDIGVWSVVSAGTPSRIKCRHCRARLKYRLTAVDWVVLCLYFGAAFVVAGVTSYSFIGQPKMLVLAFSGLLGVAAVIEFGLAWFLRTFRQLAVVETGNSEL